MASRFWGGNIGVEGFGRGNQISIRLWGGNWPMMFTNGRILEEKMKWNLFEFKLNYLFQMWTNLVILAIGMAKFREWSKWDCRLQEFPLKLAHKNESKFSNSIQLTFKNRSSSPFRCFSKICPLESTGSIILWGPIGKYDGIKKNNEINDQNLVAFLHFLCFSQFLLSLFTPSFFFIALFLQGERWWLYWRGRLGVGNFFKLW